MLLPFLITYLSLTNDSVRYEYEKAAVLLGAAASTINGATSLSNYDHKGNLRSAIPVHGAARQGNGSVEQKQWQSTQKAQGALLLP